MLSATQSKNVWPTPFECCTWHAPVQQPPTVPCAAVGELPHSQPFPGPASQSAKPLLHVRPHEPEQVALMATQHVAPQICAPGSVEYEQLPPTPEQLPGDV